MNRDDFISLLTRAVKDKFCTEAEARELLRQFDVGEIERGLRELQMCAVFQ